MEKFKALLNKIHFLPVKGSSKWVYVLGLVFIFNLATLLISRTLLGQAMTIQNTGAFIGISFLVGLIACIGYFGLEVFSLMVLAGNLMGIVYLFYIILFNASPGWNDLTSLIGLLYFIAMGVVFGIMMQFIYLLSLGKSTTKR